MNGLMVLLVIALLFTASSCGFRNQAPVTAAESVASEEAETNQGSSREAIFIYNNQPKRLVLTVGGEPVLLPSGYVRLVGVVRGERPTACLEIGGSGLALGKGEMTDGYRVTGINDGNVVLEREQQK